MNTKKTIIMRRIILTILACVFSLFSIVAQVKVKGKVIDAKGRGAMGVIISVKGKNIGTITDSQGNYALEVPSKDVIVVFTNLGEDKIEKRIEGEILNVKMNKSINSQKIILFDKHGAKVFEKENVKLGKGELSFLDFMTENEFEKMKFGKYFYLVRKGKEQKVGYLTKFTKEEQFFRGKEGKHFKETIPKVKIKNHNLSKGETVFIERDGERIQVSQDTTLYGAKIIMKNNKIVINGAIPYKEKVSLYIGDKEFPLDYRIREFDNFFQIYVSDDTKESVYIQDRNSSENKSNDLVVICSKSNTKSQKPLIIIDGIPQPWNYCLKELSPDSIGNMSIVKGEGPIAVFGAKAKNGVIIITTKKK